MKVSVIGTGYVGLVTGVCLAELGHDVCCIDTSVKKIDLLLRGISPIYEPGLAELISRNSENGRLRFSTEFHSISESEVVFIAVGTPSAEDGGADLQYVEACAKDIAAHIKEFTIVLVKSTVPVGTGDKVEAILGATLPREMFEVVSNPEFLREGAAIADFMHPDRIIVGGEGDKCRAVIAELYAKFAENGTPIHYTARRSSELIKYASNAFLATKISFINEIADLCESVGADIDEVSGGIGAESRIGNKFLQAGPGYGGSCFPKDTLALLDTANNFDVDLNVVKSAVDCNNQRKINMAKKIINSCGGDVSAMKIGVWGLTFKPSTDDMRESPALTIIPILQKAGASVIAYDPKGMQEAASLFHNVEFAESEAAVLSKAEALVVMTEWEEFSNFPVQTIADQLTRALIVDLRNCIDKCAAEDVGLQVVQIGRGTDLRVPINSDRKG